MATDSSISVKVDTSSLAQNLKQAASIFDSEFAAPASAAAMSLSQAFDKTFSAMRLALDHAARSGQVSIKSMVDSMLSDLARLSFDKLVAQPLTNFVENAVKGLFSFGGGRATGGPVSSSQAYLVGEHGPELFVPSGAGQIDPLTNYRGQGVTVNFNVTSPDAESFRRTETQLTAMLARAVARGQRGL
ncbi:MAG: phage tail tape measure C-terminal domain-containing protein [Alphaproteobacteria bacterium]